VTSNPRYLGLLPISAFPKLLSYRSSINLHFGLNFSDFQPSIYSGFKRLFCSSNLTIQPSAFDLLNIERKLFYHVLV
jgi:hypothetical protein